MFGLLALIGVGAALTAPTGGSSPTSQVPALTPRADRVAFMQQHFVSVMNVHDAVIRGDMKVARSEAQAVADRPAPPGLPQGAGPYLTAMQLGASRAAADEDLEDVAAFTASMLATCGDCHRAVGTMPALAAPASTALGGTVGHMLAHKAAADLMAQGLTVPSTAAWDEGVRQLRTAPLRRGELPNDAKLTKDILDSETRVHRLAERGLEASDNRSRIYVYSELLQSCASCHALHGNVWGPTKR